MTAKRGSRVVLVDADALDGAGCCALARGELGALEGGAGGRAAGEEAAAVAQHDLGIGADIDHQHHLVLEVRAFGEQHARGVGADMAGDAGQRVDAGGIVDRGEADLGGVELDGAVGGEREGGAAELGRVDAEQEVVHDRVADEDQLEDVVGVDHRLGGEL